jgi:hypothetical protein
MAPKPKRAALYVRVSTDGQTVDNRRLALEVVCEQRGWQVVQVYLDNGVSGAKGRNQRPGLDAMLKDASRGRFNVAVVWALDHLGRSWTLNELDAAAVALVLHQQAIDTTTPAGHADPDGHRRSGFSPAWASISRMMGPGCIRAYRKQVTRGGYGEGQQYTAGFIWGNDHEARRVQLHPIFI